MNTRFSLRDFSLLCVLLVIGIFFHVSVPDSAFLEPRNVVQLMVEAAIPATLAVALLLVILPGHIDLSAGSGVGLLGGLATVLISGTGAVTPMRRSLHGFVESTLGSTAAALIPIPPWPDPLALGVCILLAMITWGLMGALIVRQRIQAFIVTLGAMLFFRGLFWLVIESKTQPVSGPTRGQFWHAEIAGMPMDIPQDWLYRLTTQYLTPSQGLWLATIIALLTLFVRWSSCRQRARLKIEGDDGEITFVKWMIVSQLLFVFVLVCNQSQYGGVPLPVLVLGVVATGVYLLTQHTRFGRYLYATGGNEEAAHISGINVKRITITAFMLAGAIVALTGFMQTAYQGSSTSDVGELMELNAVAACVIGGVSLKGGRGTVLGVLLGALIMATLEKGMSLMGVGPELKYMVRGAVLVVAVWLDTRLHRT